MKHLIIKGIGPDRPGIVSSISKIVTSNNGNIEESRMIRVGTEFAIIIMISISEDSIIKLSEQLNTIEGIKFYLTDTQKLPSHHSPTHTIDLSGADNEGIVHSVTDTLTSMGINILEIITDTENAPVTGTILFHMRAKINLEAKDVQKLTTKLLEVEKELDLDISLESI
jgi:glycine cleavage system transcriptional repressor